jgi:hypothetical protein
VCETGWHRPHRPHRQGKREADGIEEYDRLEEPTVKIDKSILTIAGEKVIAASNNQARQRPFVSQGRNARRPASPPQRR